MGRHDLFKGLRSEMLKLSAAYFGEYANLEENEVLQNLYYASNLSPAVCSKR